MGTALDYVCCVLCVMLCVLQGAVGEYAYIKVDPNLEGDGQCSLPPTFWFSVETKMDTLTLDLTRNDHVHPKVPTYIIHVEENGEYKLKLEKAGPTNSFKRQAAYQDLIHEAAVFVSCDPHQKKGGKYEMEGTLFVKGVKYRILPSKSPVPFYRRLFYSGGEKLYHLFRAKEAVPFDTGIEAFRHEDILSNTLEEIRLPERPTRVKRQTEPTVINIDVLLLLEYSVVQEWNLREGAAQGLTKAKEYFAHVINAVNLRYQSIVSEDYKYNIRLVGYFISKTVQSSPWSELSKEFIDGKERTNATQVLTDLQEWVNRTNDQLVPYDHIMLFTGYDLVGVDNGFRFNYTTGYAFVGTMCNKEGFSISVVEDHGGFQSVGTAAHELGHSLGAEHDGSGNTCPPEDRYVMAPQSYDESETNKFNPWFFSNCSVGYFVNTTTQKLADPTLETCLKDTLTTKADVPDVGDQMPGQLYKPDEQCQHQYGSRSYMCRGTNFDVNERLCRGMFCYQNETGTGTGTGTCVQLTAARGTTCGDKKWCVNGACVQSNDAPSTDESCPHGDQPYIRTVNGDLNCNITVTQSPRQCYDAGYASQCCASCKQACDGPPDCRCRDRANCIETDCGAYSPAQRADCCYTCRNYTDTTSTSTSTSTTSATTTLTTSTEVITYPSTCIDVNQVYGVACTAYVQNKGRHICYDDHVNRSCCAVCKNVMTNSTYPNCEWGDHVPSSCFLLNSFARGSVCPRGIIKQKCCATCQEMENALNIPVVRNTPTNQATSVYASISICSSLFVVLYTF